MADRALFEAFQKVKDRVEDVVSETRKKEEKARAAEEAKRLAAKKAKAAPAPQPRFVSEEKKTLPLRPRKKQNLWPARQRAVSVRPRFRLRVALAQRWLTLL